ncbi:unnamed protein product [Scytosiphon promiscuus]
MDAWLQTQAREPVPGAGAPPPRKTLDQLVEEGLSEGDEEAGSSEMATRLQEHRDLSRRWVSGVMDATGSQRTKKQLLKIVMLGYTRSVIAGGSAPGSSPGRERLALAGIGAAGLATVVFRLLERRIQDAGEGNVFSVQILLLS